VFLVVNIFFEDDVNFYQQKLLDRLGAYRLSFSGKEILMSRFSELLEEKKVTPEMLRRAGMNRFSLWWHLKGRRPESRTAMKYCKILEMKLDKFYSYLEKEDGDG